MVYMLSLIIIELVRSRVKDFYSFEKYKNDRKSNRKLMLVLKNRFYTLSDFGWDFSFRIIFCGTFFGLGSFFRG